jgi:hypothetical protein
VALPCGAKKQQHKTLLFQNPRESVDFFVATLSGGFRGHEIYVPPFGQCDSQSQKPGFLHWHKFADISIN